MGRLMPVLWDEEGFSTAGLAIALLLTLALIFTTAQVYEIQSTSADVQDVADASALAAENVVAEYLVAAQICDAVVLTLSLGSMVLLALGVVAACVPPARAASEALIKASNELSKARDSFSSQAKQGLERLQELLPLLAALKAAEVASSNSGGTRDSSYVALALLVPLDGDEVSAGTYESSDEAQAEASDQIDELSQEAQEAEEAAAAASEAKERAWEHDCGLSPSYCMQERAQRLAGMSGADNPSYATAETWSFSVALERARLYYSKRAASEAPASSSVADKSNSALRKRFYEYACSQLESAYVVETQDSFSAYFPVLFRNTEELRATDLYTEAVYPITQSSDGTLCMHAWSGCPNAGGSIELGSIAELEANSQGFSTCAACEFVSSSLGNVAAASTSIENGFEYHYRIVAEAAQEYQQQRARLDPLSAQVKERASALFDRISEALGQAASARIEVSPPGRYGVVVLAADVAAHGSSGHFSTSFVESSGSLGPCVALSSAALARDSSDEGKSVVSSALDGFGQDSGVVVDAGKVVLGVWSDLLGAYTSGQEALVSAVESGIDRLPLASESGLGSWSAKQVQGLIDAVGLEAPDLTSAKAVLCNSAHPLSQSDDAFASSLLSVKARALSAGADDTTLFDSALSQGEAAALQAVESYSSEIQIASIVLFDGAIEVPITIALPAALQEGAAGLVSSAFDALRGLSASVIGERRWE